jgi:hypothetical protein
LVGRGGVLRDLAVDVVKASGGGIALGVQLAVLDRWKLRSETVVRGSHLADVEALDWIRAVIAASIRASRSSRDSSTGGAAAWRVGAGWSMAGEDVV